MTSAARKIATSTSQAPAPYANGSTKQSFFHKVWSSLHDSIGEIVFGMEDGTVSIFGLVFGVAATAPDATTVLVAGATSAAVSMMAGTFLDVESARDQARARLVGASQRISHDPGAEADREHDRLTEMGFSEEDATSLVAAIQRTPGGALKFASAFELQIGDADSRIGWSSRYGCSSRTCLPRRFPCCLSRF
jgi:hypothetical protein